jgi:hypothetical protein
MAVIEGGTSGLLAEVGAAAAMPQHVSEKPIPYGTLGHYQMAFLTGNMAAGLAADSEIFQFRWTDATRLAVLMKVELDGAQSLATGFAAGACRFRLTPARGWSIDGTGGANPTVTGNNNKLRTSMGTMLMANTSIRVATTAALGVGTKTLDAQDISQVNNAVAAAVQTQFIPPNTTLFEPDIGSGRHPLVFAQNEGFVIRATVPATGVWQVGLTIAWAEVTAY